MVYIRDDEVIRFEFRFPGACTEGLGASRGDNHGNPAIPSR